MRYVRHIAINDLDKCFVPIVCKKVKGESLDTCCIHDMPLLILPLELGVGCGLGLLSNRPDSRGPIDGLLGAGDISQPEKNLC